MTFYIKRFLSLVLIFSFILVCTFSISYAKPMLHSKKIISVVYDDSASMLGPNWSYANYALQAFMGLTNEEDIIYLTYMYDCVPKQINSKNIQKEIGTIRNHTTAGGTPYDAVVSAYNTLKVTPETEPNVEYWLIIMTDGEFGITPDELQRNLDSYVREQMPNGTTAKVTYFAMAGAEAPKADPENGLYVYPEDGSTINSGEQIIKSMSTVADKVSGRTRINDVNFVDSKTIEIESDLPLLSISLLTQKTDASISSAKTDNGTKLKIQRECDLKCPQNDCSDYIKDLRGKAYIIDNGDKIIENGKYIVEFSNTIDKDSLVVMYEPAVELILKFYAQDGTEITDPGILSDGEKIKAVCTPCILGTGVALPQKDFPANTTFSIKISNNGNTDKEVSDYSMTIDNYVLHEGNNEVLGTVTIPGFAPITVRYPFKTQKAMEIVSIISGDGMNLDLPGLKNNKDSVVFEVTKSGARLTENEVKALGFTVVSDMPGDMVINSDGTISFTPKYQSPVTSIPTGSVEVTGKLNNGKSATGHINVKIDYVITSDVPSDNGLSIQEPSRQQPIKFDISVSGTKLDKTEISPDDLTVTFNDKFNGKVVPEITIEDDGTVSLKTKPKFGSLIGLYLTPRGNMEVTVTAPDGTSETVTVPVYGPGIVTTILMWAIPFAVLFLLFFVSFKKRFKLHSAIYTVYVTGSGHNTVRTTQIIWKPTRLPFWKVFLIPRKRDVCVVDGVKFYATGGESVQVEIPAGTFYLQCSKDTICAKGSFDNAEPFGFKMRILPESSETAVIEVLREGCGIIILRDENCSGGIAYLYKNN